MLAKIKENFREKIAPRLVGLSWLSFILLYYAVSKDIPSLMAVAFLFLALPHICFTLFN